MNRNIITSSRHLAFISKIFYIIATTIFFFSFSSSNIWINFRFSVLCFCQQEIRIKCGRNMIWINVMSFWNRYCMQWFCFLAKCILVLMHLLNEKANCGFQRRWSRLLWNLLYINERITEEQTKVHIRLLHSWWRDKQSSHQLLIICQLSFTQTTFVTCD